MSEQKRWPKNAEAARGEAEELARMSTARLREARQEIKKNPMLAEVMISDTQTDLERIYWLMKTAKHGSD